MYESNPVLVQPDQLNYVPLAMAHVPIVLPVEHEAYPDPWTQGMFLQEVRNGASHFYLAFYGEMLVAYGGFWLLIDEIHLTKLTVARPFRGGGLGAALLAFLEERGRAAGGTIVRLEVRESNAVARRLYAGAGYEEIGKRRGYYGASGEDAVVMAKKVATR